MKFEKNTTIKGAFIPHSALALSGFSEEESVALHALPSAIVLVKKRMTAMDLLNSMDALSKLAADLTTELFKLCGSCDDCQGEGCPYEDVDGPIDLPDYLREEAGIPKDAKLCAEVDEGERSVTIYAAGHQHDLSDVPKDLWPLLESLGICLGELEQKLISGEVVCDG